MNKNRMDTSRNKGNPPEVAGTLQTRPGGTGRAKKTANHDGQTERAA